MTRVEVSKVNQRGNTRKLIARVRKGKESPLINLTLMKLEAESALINDHLRCDINHDVEQETFNDDTSTHFAFEIPLIISIFVATHLLSQEMVTLI